VRALTIWWRKEYFLRICSREDLAWTAPKIEETTQSEKMKTDGTTSI